MNYINYNKKSYKHFNSNKKFYLSFEHLIMMFKKEYPHAKHPP
ncbi:MAG: hypothetical protein ACRC5R_05980 [Mycoplasmatales bacterium]